MGERDAEERLNGADQIGIGRHRGVNNSVKIGSEEETVTSVRERNLTERERSSCSE